ncbi:hypothetical protein ACVNPS_09305 [Candidatus Bipolaricaulota sp. J31]
MKEVFLGVTLFAGGNALSAWAGAHPGILSSIPIFLLGSLYGGARCVGAAVALALGGCGWVVWQGMMGVGLVAGALCLMGWDLAAARLRAHKGRGMEVKVLPKVWRVVALWSLARGSLSAAVIWGIHRVRLGIPFWGLVLLLALAVISLRLFLGNVLQAFPVTIAGDRDANSRPTGVLGFPRRQRSSAAGRRGRRGPTR